MRRFALPLVAALLGAAFSAGLLRKGVILGPDSWAYWEGSVSVLQMRQYSYFGGEPIVSFPPLFSWVLALFQAALGISVRTLAVSLAVLVAAASFAWTMLYVVLAGKRPAVSVHDILAALYVPASLAIYAQVLLSETLWLVLLPILLIVPVAPGHPQSALRQGLRATIVWVILVGLLLCRNATVGLLPAVFLLLIRSDPEQPLRRRFAMATAVTAAAVIPWYLIRQSLGQLAYHPLGSAQAGVLEHSGRMLAGLAYALGPDRWLMGQVLLAACGFLVIWEVIGRRRTGAHRLPSYVAHAEFAAVGLAGLAVLFSATYVGEPLAGRFVVFAALVLTLVILAAAASAPAGFRQRALTGVAILLTAAALYRVGVKYHLAGSEQPVEALNVTINASYWTGPPRPGGDLLLVAPPTYPWQQRSGLR